MKSMNNPLLKIKNLSKESKLNIILLFINLILSTLFFEYIAFIVQHLSQVPFVTMDFVIALILFTTPFICYLRGYKSYSIFISLFNSISFFLINYLNFAFYMYGIKTGIQMGFYVFIMILIIFVLLSKREN